MTTHELYQKKLGTVADALHDKNDLGIYTEIFCTSAGRLMQSGVVTNRRKNFHTGKTVCGFVWGDQPFYEFIHRNPDIELLPAPYVNDPYHIAHPDFRPELRREADKMMLW